MALLRQTDRSSTGYVPQVRHDGLAAAFYRQPEASADGWERAVDAQRRIIAALADLLAETAGAALAVVGQGGVGTLLLCHLAALPIDQRHDQDGPRHFFTYDRSAGQLRPTQEMYSCPDRTDCLSLDHGHGNPGPGRS